MSQPIYYNLYMSCRAINRDGKPCSRRSASGKTRCKQHINIAKREKQKEIAQQARIINTITQIFI